MNGELLRMPRARAYQYEKEPRLLHKGIIVEKSGEDNDTSKKNRVMYLYSPTVRKHCGKLVCSTDWRDYQLGDWINFTQSSNEAYFGSFLMNKPPYPTRISPTTYNIVQVYVHFFIVPNFISHRRTFHLGEPLQKAWSPELGGMYIDHKTLKRFNILDNKLYKGWVQYSLHTVNFDVHDQDPEGWPYEPTVHWHLLYEGYQDDPEIVDNLILFEKFLNDFQVRAKEAKYEEMEKRNADRKIQNFLLEEDRKLKNKEANAYTTVAKHGHLYLKQEPKFTMSQCESGFGRDFGAFPNTIATNTLTAADFEEDPCLIKTKPKEQEEIKLTSSYQASSSNQTFFGQRIEPIREKVSVSNNFFGRKIEPIREDLSQKQEPKFTMSHSGIGFGRGFGAVANRLNVSDFGEDPWNRTKSRK